MSGKPFFVRTLLTLRRNQTNLAIKGIIGLQAMSEIEKLTGHTGNQAKYAKIASEYLKFWNKHGINSNATVPHSMLQYDKPKTYGRTRSALKSE